MDSEFYFSLLKMSNFCNSFFFFFLKIFSSTSLPELKLGEILIPPPTHTLSIELNDLQGQPLLTPGQLPCCPFLIPELWAFSLLGSPL